MKKILLLILVLFHFSIYAQIVSVNPNQANRGQSLVTTITPSGSIMTTSSGFSGMYHFTLEQGSYVIPENSYTLAFTGLGFASAAYVTFVIPYNALIGFYDVHIKNQFWSWGDAIKVNAFEIFETGTGGTVFFDGNQNGVFDANDQGLNHQTILINPLNTIVSTDINGHYRGYLSAGTYATSLVVPPNFILTTGNASHTITVPPDTTGLDFGIYTPPSSTFVHDFISDGGRLRCLRPSYATWSVTSGSNNIQNGTITLIKDNALGFVGSQPSPSSINNDTIRWNYTLQPFEVLNAELILQGGTFNSYVEFAIIDSLFDTLGTFISTSVDSFNTRVLCSFDPNEKNVFPMGDSIFHYTAKTQELKYTIRFQNCGSDTALNITVRDTIDHNLDINTMHVLYSSAPMTSQIENNDRVRFTFNNILLPDSGTDELNSHGMIIYSIKPKGNLPDFTVVRNRAHIYFDLNNALATNSIFNTLVDDVNVGMGTSQQSGKSLIYPNPVTGKSILTLPDKKEFLLNIYSDTGKNIISISTSENYVINTNQMKAGIYYYQLIDKEEMKAYNGKFVIIK